MDTKTTVGRFCAALAAVSFSTSAFGFSWDDAQDGAIVISEPVAVTSDADAAKMAALTSITLAEGGSISCSGLSAAQTIQAAFSGPGSFDATDCAGVLTFSGDSHLLTGGFAFTNTPVVVANRYGLGSADSRACSIHYGSAGTLDFAWNETYLTNDVAFVTCCADGASNQIFGPTDAAKTLVQRGGVKIEKAGSNHYFKFRGKIIFDGCRFETKPGEHLYSSSSGSPECWFTESSTIYIGSYWFALGSEKYHFACTIEKLSEFAPNTPVNVVFEKKDVFLDSTILSMYDDRTTDDAALDLNGYDQPIKYMQCQRTVGDGKYGHVKSARKAVLKLCDTATTERQAEYKFTGSAGIHQAGNYVQKLVGVVSTSKGDLTVSSGGFELASNAGWSGTNVVVEGGVLILNSPNAFTTADAKLVVKDTGKLRIHNTVSTLGAYFGEVWLGPTQLAFNKTYTGAELKALAGDYIDAATDDDAILKVAFRKVEWKGWPEEGGEVTISENMTVGISDEDVEKVARVTKLTILQEAKVLCTNAVNPLVLSATVEGSGTIDITSPAGVTLAGDSSGLDSPGCFIAHDTVVTVTHRYGLGDAGTAAFQSLGGDLVFRGNGLTNDAAVFYNGAAARMFGPREGRGPWVQNGDFLTDNGGSGHYTFFTNDCVFGGTCRYGATKNAVLFYNLCKSSALSAGPDTTLYYAGENAEYYYLANAADGSAFNLAGHVSPNPAINRIHPHFAVIWINCERKDIFAGLKDGLQAYGSTYPVGGLNLNGFDQQVNVLRIQEGEDKVESSTYKYCIAVSNEAPATLTITKPMSGTIKSGIRFTGAANFTYAAQNADPYKLYWQQSTSTGALTVESGTLTFEQGNSWGGTNVFLKGGTLSIAPETTNPFTAATARGKANADLVVTGGTLHLGGADVVAAVRCLKVGDAYLPRGEYRASAQNPWLTGAGKVTVRKDRPDSGLCILVR